MRRVGLYPRGALPSNGLVILVIADAFVATRIQLEHLATDPIKQYGLQREHDLPPQ